MCVTAELEREKDHYHAGDKDQGAAEIECSCEVLGAEEDADGSFVLLFTAPIGLDIHFLTTFSVCMTVESLFIQTFLAQTSYNDRKPLLLLVLLNCAWRLYRK